MAPRRSLPVILLWVLLGLVLTTSPTEAHATLQGSDPPIDSLLVSSPDVITMSFTEDVATNPAPIVRVLNDQGDLAGDDPLPITIDPDQPQTMTVTIPPLDRGTWTVAWTVTSATDGHTLSGTWAFRIGGGLPPGIAQHADASPAGWAVALRWLTFLGAAGAAGMLLFPFLTQRREGDALWRTRSIRIAWLAATLALVATLLEPVAAWLADRSTSLPDHLQALPDAWAWRPLTLLPLMVMLGIFLVRRRVPGAVIECTGGGLALLSMLGLVLTSHAAGQDDFRFWAIGFNAVHQWSVALWTGGLLAFAIWAVLARGTPDRVPRLRLGTTSAIALLLFLVGVVTGTVNTGFMLPIVQNLRDDGFSINAFSDLWDSRYGVVLLIKVLLLIIPLALAVYHRQTILRLGRQAGAWVSTIPTTMNRTLRWEAAAVTLVILGGSTLAMSSPPAPEVPGVDQITLVSPTTSAPTDDSLLVHLTVDPAHTGDNVLIVRLTDWNGQPLPADPAPRVTLAFTSLNHGTFQGGVALAPDAEDPQYHVTSGLNLSLDGWWQITTTVQRAGMQNATAEFELMLPDPNTQGFTAPNTRVSDPAAETLFTAALDRMTSWRSVRWTELIGSGQDVLLIGEFAVIESTDDAPNAYKMDLAYSGSFAERASGEPPAAPTFDSRSSITIGDEAWMQTMNGDWLEEPPTRFIPPSGWNTTYAGATSFQLGTPQRLDGTEYQLVTFHLPEQPGQAEAWFAWWIDPSSHDVVQVAMISRMHYMLWLYHDIDNDFEILPPD